MNYMGTLNIDHSKTDRGVVNNKRSVFGEGTLSADYFNDDSNEARGVGETGLNKKYFGFDIVSFVSLECAQAGIRYDRDTERIRVFLYDDSGGGTGPADEAPDGEDLSSIIFTFYALGT